MIKNYGPFMKVVVYLSLALALVTVASCAKKAPSGSSATEDSNSLSTVAPSEEPEGVILTEPGQVAEIEVTVGTEAQTPVSEESEETVVARSQNAQDEEPVSEAPANESSDTNDKSDWVPIKIDLPKAIFVGTPEDLVVDNLEKATNKARPPFLAPPGTENVALHKPVTSGHEPIWGDLKYITDGDKEAVEGSFVQLAPFKEYITIDLEKEYNIWAIVVWHYHLQPRVYFDVIVQVADDPDFLTNVKTLFNNDNDNSYGLGIGKDKNYLDNNEGKLIEGKGVKARYVRLHSNKNSSDDMNHYIEVSVYGTPVE